MKLLSEEVEMLSVKNERLLKDLKIKDFYATYNSVLEEVIFLVTNFQVGKSEKVACGSYSNFARRV